MSPINQQNRRMFVQLERISIIKLFEKAMEAVIILPRLVYIRSIKLAESGGGLDRISETLFSFFCFLFCEIFVCRVEETLPIEGGSSAVRSELLLLKL